MKHKKWLIVYALQTVFVIMEAATNLSISSGDPCLSIFNYKIEELGKM